MKRLSMLEELFIKSRDFININNQEYKKGDFYYQEKYTFEVGIGNKIALWLFGFLY